MNENETDIIYHITIYSKLQHTAIKMFEKKKHTEIILDVLKKN